MAQRRVRVELVAHRGESADAPENTLAAFRLAWERQAEAIELDVHRTRDNQLVVIHDPDTQRTTGASRLVRESTLADLRGLDAGSWKDPMWAGEPLPTLGAVLATIPDEARARAFIEVKVGPEAVPALIDAVHASGKAPAQLAVISFQVDTLAESRRHLPALKHYLLADLEEDKAGGGHAPTLADWIALAHDIGADGLDLGGHGLIDIDAAFVREVKAAGLELFVWTIDDPAVARRLVAAGVDGITTNRAAWLRSQLGAG